MDFGRNVWCIAGVPVAAWAREVFPGTSDAEATYRLWNLILSVARADGDDPESAWETHNASFEKTKRFLSSHHFDALRYEASNGTNLIVGMNPGHVWDGGAARTQDGTTFFPNIPTEEVFTSPNRARAEGIVYSAMPLVHAGQIVRDFWLRFEAGRVVDFGAEQGAEVLRHIIETDDNSCRLGECALISRTRPSARARPSSSTRSTTRTRPVTWRLAWASRSAWRAASTWARRSFSPAVSTRAWPTWTS